MNKKNLPQNENKVKNKTSKISIISPKKNSINICKKQQSISKFDRNLNNQNENEIKNKLIDSLNFVKTGKRNKNQINKLSNSINSQKTIPLSGSIYSSISVKKTIKVNTPKFKETNSLREKILLSDDKMNKNNSNFSISSVHKISKINSRQKIKVNKSKNNNIYLKKINNNNNNNNINNNNNVINNIGNSINANKTTNYSSFETIDKNKNNFIKPNNLENKFNKIKYEYNEEESNFLNIELGNSKNFSILPDYSINLLNSPQEYNKIEEKEINMEDFFSNPLIQPNFSIFDFNNPEPSLYYIDTNEMKEGEDIQRVYSMTMNNNEKVNFDRDIKSYNHKNFTHNNKNNNKLNYNKQDKLKQIYSINKNNCKNIIHKKE